MDNDIKKLKHEISIYETHLQKTEIWIDNLGKWTTKVTGASVTNPSDESFASTTNLSNTNNEHLLLFEIHVELHENLNLMNEHMNSINNKENMNLLLSNATVKYGIFGCA